MVKVWTKAEDSGFFTFSLEKKKDKYVLEQSDLDKLHDSFETIVESRLAILKNSILDDFHSALEELNELIGKICDKCVRDAKAGINNIWSDYGEEDRKLITQVIASLQQLLNRHSES